jgi:hypothetical protein
MITLEIPSKDESFSCVIEWLNEHPYTQNCRQLTVETVYDQNDPDRAPRLVFSPSEGDHFFSYQGKWIWLKRHIDSSLDISMGMSATRNFFTIGEISYDNFFVLVSLSLPGPIISLCYFFSLLIPSLGGKSEVITLTAFGREKTVFKNLVGDAMELNRRKERGRKKGEGRREGEEREEGG